MPSSSASPATFLLPLQSWSDSRRVSPNDLARGVLTAGAYGLPLTDAGEGALRALLEMGARLALERDAKTEWSVRATLPGFEARLSRPLRFQGVVLLEVTAPPDRAKALARAVHNHVGGDAAFRYTNPRALAEIPGGADGARRLWLDLLARPAEAQDPPRAAPKAMPPPASAKPPPKKPLQPRTMRPLDALAALGLKDGAEWAEIQKAYRALAMKLHPDRTGGDRALEEEFKRVNTAYERLKALRGK